jgi:hypothetical protein
MFIKNINNTDMKFIKYLLVAITTLSFAGCAKEEVKETETEVGHSRIVFFPSIEIKGEHLVILNQGGTFTDPGVTALLAGQPTTTTTTGTVNTATPGIYNLVYTAANTEGNTVSDFRTVVVIGNDVVGKDISGTYLRAATGITSTWTKTATGVYTVENPGGAGVGAGLTVIGVNYTGNKIAIPKQVSPDFGVASTQAGSESYDPATGTIKYIFLAGGYGTGSRTFVKQ